MKTKRFLFGFVVGMFIISIMSYSFVVALNLPEPPPSPVTNTNTGTGNSTGSNLPGNNNLGTIPLGGQNATGGGEDNASLYIGMGIFLILILVILTLVFLINGGKKKSDERKIKGDNLKKKEI